MTRKMKVPYATLVGPAETLLRSTNKDAYHLALTLILPQIVRQINEQFDGTSIITILLKEKFTKEVEDFIIEVLEMKQWHASIESENDQDFYVKIQPATIMLANILDKIQEVQKGE